MMFKVFKEQHDIMTYCGVQATTLLLVVWSYKQQWPLQLEKTTQHDTKYIYSKRRIPSCSASNVPQNGASIFTIINANVDNSCYLRHSPPKARMRPTVNSPIPTDLHPCNK